MEQHENRIEFSGVVVLLVVGAIGTIVLAGVVVGVWGAALVTLGFALAAIVAVVLWSSRRSHPPAGDAPHVRPPEDGRHRILVVTDQSGASPSLCDSLRERAGERPCGVFVIAPALESRMGLVAGDQKGYDEAAEHLNATVAALAASGLEAQGRIGASDPLQCADDGLRQFPANEIVFVTHPESGMNWLEEGVVALAQERYEQPVTHVVLGPQ